MMLEAKTTLSDDATFQKGAKAQISNRLLKHRRIERVDIVEGKEKIVIIK